MPSSHLYLLCMWNLGRGLNPVLRDPIQAFALVLLGRRVNFLSLLAAAPQTESPGNWIKTKFPTQFG